MIRTWLRRWLGLELERRHSDMAPTSLERRVAELEQHVDFLHGALRKLRGRVTGAIRSNGDLPAGDGEAVTDARSIPPPTIDHIPRQWELAELAARTKGAEWGRMLKGGT